MKKNLITITRHPSVSCYVEEGTRSGKLRECFVSKILMGGRDARMLDDLCFSSFYFNFANKSQAEKDLWTNRLGRLHLFTGLHME